MNRPPPTAESSHCALCGSRSAEYVYPRLGMIRCVGCGLIRTREIPDKEQLEALYSEGYFHSSDSGALGYDDYVGDRSKITRTFHRRMQEIEKVTGGKGRLLDVGCAMGFSLQVARERGWDALGVEVSGFACDYARENLGIDILCGSLDEARLQAESFDVITMWDYIEHNPAPVEELNEASRLLRTGGLLALTTPDISSLVARITGNRWMGIKQGEHLYYFSSATLRHLLTKCGFEPIRLKYVGKYVDLGFFIKRTGIYSATVERLLSRTARTLGIADHVLYVNPFDILLAYGKKVAKVK